jgi:hypothetical protein
MHVYAFALLLCAGRDSAAQTAQRPDIGSDASGNIRGREERKWRERESESEARCRRVSCQLSGGESTVLHSIVSVSRWPGSCAAAGGQRRGYF